jgi:hypothetical protein
VFDSTPILVESSKLQVPASLAFLKEPQSSSVSSVVSGKLASVNMSGQHKPVFGGASEVKGALGGVEIPSVVTVSGGKSSLSSFARLELNEAGSRAAASSSPGTERDGARCPSSGGYRSVEESDHIRRDMAQLEVGLTAPGRGRWGEKLDTGVCAPFSSAG